MQGIFYGVGVGPGDPELITLKAVNILKTVDVIAIPESAEGKERLAYEIAKEYLKDGIKIMQLTFPMIRDVAERENMRKENSLKIEKEVKDGKKVAFLTLGDPMLYSTYTYLLENLKGKIEINTIPGIMSFSAIAAKENIPLVQGEEILTIVPVNKTVDIKSKLQSNENIVFLKVSSDNKRVAEEIKNSGLENNFVMVSQCGFKEEVSSKQISDIEKEKQNYFTTIIVKKRGLI